MPRCLLSATGLIFWIDIPVFISKQFFLELPVRTTDLLCQICIWQPMMYVHYESKSISSHFPCRSWTMAAAGTWWTRVTTKLHVHPSTLWWSMTCLRTTPKPAHRHLELGECVSWMDWRLLVMPFVSLNMGLIRLGKVVSLICMKYCRKANVHVFYIDWAISAKTVLETIQFIHFHNFPIAWMNAPSCYLCIMG